MVRGTIVAAAVLRTAPLLLIVFGLRTNSSNSRISIVGVASTEFWSQDISSTAHYAVALVNVKMPESASWIQLVLLGTGLESDSEPCQFRCQSAGNDFAARAIGP